MRSNGRLPHQLRPVRIVPGAVPYAEGSALIEMGHTRVICAASVEPDVPPWLRGQGRGWVTGEYALLPRATLTRTRRERSGPTGRTQEIQRLIGRSLRAAVDLDLLGEHLITVDCDVLQADGGTRTAAITGGFVALALALEHMHAAGLVEHHPLRCAVAAVSVGVVGETLLLDLDYDEDHAAEVDGNIVQTEHADFVEVQSTAEGLPISRAQLNTLLDLAAQGIAQLLHVQREALRSA
ncbi:MAG: ribonuclease PH [Chloroflexaceae bacterium]|nr:ribonuclease PH [Chloroflexaceae bacterium]